MDWFHWPPLGYDPRVYFMIRIIFLIDGFNLYHSILDIQRRCGYSTKWLYIAALCNSYVHLFGRTAELQEIRYFTAIPYYLTSQRPDKTQRHKKYIECLESTGIQIEFGRFKEKYMYCDRCKTMVLKHGEKFLFVAFHHRTFFKCMKK